jgi:hypothetical protein
MLVDIADLAEIDYGMLGVLRSEAAPEILEFDYLWAGQLTDQPHTAAPPRQMQIDPEHGNLSWELHLDCEFVPVQHLFELESDFHRRRPELRREDDLAVCGRQLDQVFGESEEQSCARRTR